MDHRTNEQRAKDFWHMLAFLMAGYLIQSMLLPLIARLEEEQARYDREFAEIVERY